MEPARQISRSRVVLLRSYLPAHRGKHTGLIALLGPLEWVVGKYFTDNDEAHCVLCWIAGENTVLLVYVVVSEDDDEPQILPQALNFLAVRLIVLTGFVFVLSLMFTARRNYASAVLGVVIMSVCHTRALWLM